MKITSVKAIPCPGSWMNWTFGKVTTDEVITGRGIELDGEEIAKHRRPEN